MSTQEKRIAAYMNLHGYSHAEALAKIKENPAPRSTAPKAAKKRMSKKAYINRPSQAGENRAPSQRLKARRKANLEAPKGVYPNPARPIKKQPASIAGSGVTIKYDPDYKEYSVHVRGNPNATYYTDDKNDAISTAQDMRNRLLKQNPLKPGITARIRKGKPASSRKMLSVDYAKTKDGPWTIAGVFPNRTLAVEYARGKADQHPNLWWRVATI